MGDDDLFSNPDGIHDDDQGIKRDRYGRYVIPDPKSGKEKAWTRATTFAKSASDTAALVAWAERMTIKGLMMRPDLQVLASATPIDDRDTLNEIAVKAKDTAGANTAANLGTALHSLTEAIDQGDPGDDIPEPWASRVRAYRAALDDAGIEVFRHEDRLMIEQVVVIPRFKVAGTLDRIITGPRWDLPVIADLKTGARLDYAWKEIAIQLALYAHAEYIWDYRAKEFLSMPEVDQNVGVVFHLPVNETFCNLWEVDIDTGWAAAELCHRVRNWRKFSGLATQIGGSTVTAAPVATATGPVDWAAKIRMATSTNELSMIWFQAKQVNAWTPELQELGQTRAKEIQEAS